MRHHNGIFRSTDAARSRSEIEKAGPSTFGFAAAVHPRGPDTAWFVPGVRNENRTPVDGKVVVTRTREGSRSFDILSDGLPQEHAYDIAYRHGLDIDETGDRLAFAARPAPFGCRKTRATGGRTCGHTCHRFCVRFA